MKSFTKLGSIAFIRRAWRGLIGCAILLGAIPLWSQTNSSLQFAAVMSTNWAALPGAMHFENDTNGVQIQYLVEREVVSSNWVVKVTYNGKSYPDYVLESTTTPLLSRRHVPIQAERPPFPTPLPQPVAVSSNAIYYRELKP